MALKIIYEDKDVLVVDKPAGKDMAGVEKSLPSGARPAHRLDKDTSGVLLAAKNEKTLQFLQKQFTPLEVNGAEKESKTHKPLTGLKQRKVEKKYLALCQGELKPKRGKIETLIGRDPKQKTRQKAEIPFSPGAQRQGLRKAITEYLVLQKFTPHHFSRKKSGGGFQEYCLVEVKPKTGRRHQIRVHLAYLGHPIVGDKVYGFKNQALPEGLKRQFLHSHSLKIQLPDGQTKEFVSQLPQDLKKIKL